MRHNSRLAWDQRGARLSADRGSNRGIIKVQCLDFRRPKSGARGEVGSASAMAAAGLCAINGGHARAGENAAESRSSITWA